MSRSATPSDVLAGTARWCVVEGDSAAVMASLPERSVDHIITDPPYEAEAHKGARRQSKDQGHGAEEYTIPFAAITSVERDAFGAVAGRVARGWVLAFCQVEAVAAWRKALGGKWRRAAAWIKPDAAPQFDASGWAQGFECIASAWVGVGRSRWYGGGRRGVFAYCVNDYGRLERPHPTTKPIGLMVELVGLFSAPSDVILDPYAGSGTTGVAALRLGRRAILVERVAEYAETARRRCEEAEAADPIGLYQSEPMKAGRQGSLF